MLEIKQTTKFKKDLKVVRKRNYNMELLDEVVELLKNEQMLPAKYHDHDLHGEYERL